MVSFYFPKAILSLSKRAQIAMRFGLFCIPIWCILECDLVYIAFAFGVFCIPIYINEKRKSYPITDSSFIVYRKIIIFLQKERVLFY